MTDWKDYVRRFYAMTSDQQRAEWEKLTPEQRAQFESARSSPSSPAIPHSARKGWTFPKLAAVGCAAVVGLGVIGFTVLAMIGALANGSQTQVAAPASERVAPRATEPSSSREKAPASQPARAPEPTLTDRATIEGQGNVGCSNRATMERLRTYAAQGDREAYARAVSTGVAANDCVLFTAGESVHVMGSSWVGFARVRRPGETTEYWLASGALTR